MQASDNLLKDDSNMASDWIHACEAGITLCDHSYRLLYCVVMLIARYTAGVAG